ncbi:MAG: hypothetical protein HC826_00265 [Rhodospirillales bacterium]|nr:hypothetical protein [Rhodospirillales bacterium]
MGVFCLIPAQAAGMDWSAHRVPTATAGEVFGAHSLGCFSGGEALALNGNGFQVMRPSRNRYYGHPALIQFLNDLAADLASQAHPAC